VVREGDVSYKKVERLLALATLVAGRHVGVTLDDVIERFGVSKRTAQRMLRALAGRKSQATRVLPP
jgi:predicted DNA-binding transcriptional regulator YafY